MIQEPDLLRGPEPSKGLMETAYRRLKREIIELARPPGETFTEPKVASDFGLSKTPVREALARLHRDGLVQPLPRAGYVVKPVTLGDAADLSDLRILLQSEAAALCAARGLDDKTLARLRDLVDDSDGGDAAASDLTGNGAEANRSLEEHLRANYEFETIIANGSGNERLAAAVATLLDDLERIARLMERIVTSGLRGPRRVEERRAIVDAIEARDEDAARSAMAVRATSARDEIVRTLSMSPSVTSVAILVPHPSMS